MIKTRLCEIAYKYGTDKCPQINHSYTPFYYQLLKDKRKSFRKIIEVGIGRKTTRHNYPKQYVTGAGLRMWRDFFPNAHIYGADIAPETMFTDERIVTYICDSTKKESLERLIKQTGSDIDLFVDDGSHYKKSQIFLCQTIMPLLKKDIIYIIEDVKFPQEIVDALGEYDCFVPEIPKRSRDDGLVIVKNKLRRVLDKHKI